MFEPVKVVVTDKMQSGYSYWLTKPEGKGFDPDFKPDLTPIQMLEAGVFGGKYMTDCTQEFPASWFEHAVLSPAVKDPEKTFSAWMLLNRFRIGEVRIGFFTRIPEGGFSGTAAITEDADVLMTNGRLHAGRRWEDMQHSCKSIAGKAIYPAGRDSARLCFIGHMRAEKCKVKSYTASTSL
jgi:hypothetical protein